MTNTLYFFAGLCGHFALGTLSETYLKDAVFEINVQDQNITKKDKITNCQFQHQNQKNVSELAIILSQLAHVHIRHFFF